MSSNMSSKDTLNVIPTEALFACINQKRVQKYEPVIEESLLASKLGILVAVNTNHYVNFKGETAELTGRQIIALGNILDEYFNVNMHDDIRNLVIPPKEPESRDPIEEHDPTLLQRLKGFFGRRRHTEHVGMA